VLNREGLAGRVVRTQGRSRSRPEPGRLGGDELPWARTLASELQRAGAPVVMYQVP